MQEKPTDHSDLFNILIEESKTPIALYEGDHLIISVANKAILKAWGKDDSVKGMELAKALPELANQPFLQLLREVIRTGIAYEAKEDMVQLMVDGDLRTFYFDFIYKPLFDQNGKVWAILNNATDVTELVKARLKYQEKEALFRQMIYDAPIAIGVLRGQDFIIEDANVDLLKIWGKTEKVIGKKLLDGLPEIADQQFPQILAQVYQSGKPYYGYETLARVERDGVLGNYYFNFVYDPIFDQDKKVSGIMIVASDVTAQVNSQLNLKESEARFRTLVQDNPMPTAFYETEDIVIKIANNEMLKLWDKDKSIIGKPMIEGIPELAGQPFIPILKEVFRSGIPYHADQQEAVLVMDGVPTKSWFNFTYKPLRNATGKVYGILHAAIDVTRQVQLQQQKDEFLGIASHELKTPVTSVKAYTQVLERMIRLEGDEKKANMVHKMDQQLNRLTGLIGDLLDVTKIQAGKMVLNLSTFDFDNLVKDIVEEMQHTTLKHQLNATLNSFVKVETDRERIGQVITNFLSNAIKYADDADNVEIKSEVIGNEVILSVKDYGIGISEDLQQYVFDQFYRVSGHQQHTYPGLGLGLYISAEIIKNTGGRIWLESEAGTGSTFYFALKIKA
ncbi:ATP-binding protein [Pedobacter sp. GR22-10]|uniref:PAS domain-containing sensor histidine kinase n=1 Tax=Pedobacter sp. GR22-10 TaxID=2994472 RepID=UPI00224759FB|nr:ATP-binding protein [Pedobacter sp. GR22-10]MCX2429162.1 ATP-binding protein [Pedobacter sp. GR22-10]